MVKVTVMRKKKAEWRSSVGNSQGQSSWPHSIPQNCAVRDLWVKGCEEVPMFLGKVFWGFTVCFIVCIRLNGRMTMFYFHTMFTFQEPAHYLPLWRASCRSLLPQQGCTQNAEGLVMKSHIQNILVLPTRCRFGWFDDVCLGTSKTPTRSSTLCMIVYAYKTLKHNHQQHLLVLVLMLHRCDVTVLPGLQHPPLQNMWQVGSKGSGG